MWQFPTLLFTLMASPYPFAVAEESEGSNRTAEQKDWIPSFTFGIISYYSTRRSSTVPNKFHPWRTSAALPEDTIVQSSLRSLLWTFTPIPTCVVNIPAQNLSAFKKATGQKTLVLKAKGFLKATQPRKYSLFFFSCERFIGTTGTWLSTDAQKVFFVKWEISKCLLTAILLSDFPHPLLASLY